MSLGARCDWTGARLCRAWLHVVELKERAADEVKDVVVKAGARYRGILIAEEVRRGSVTFILKY